MINWFVPKRYAKLSEEEYNNLDIVKPVKNSGASIGVGIIIILNVLFRKYIDVFNVQVQESVAILSCVIGFLGIFIFFLYINKKVTLDIYKRNKTKSKIILIPTLKNFGGISWVTMEMLTIDHLYNIFMFIVWIGIIAAFFFVNMFAIMDKKVHIILKNKEMNCHG